MRKLTKELVAGDVVEWASDLSDTVVTVTPMSPFVARIDVIRNGKREFFFAGMEAAHRVTSTTANRR